MRSKKSTEEKEREEIAKEADKIAKRIEKARRLKEELEKRGVQVDNPVNLDTHYLASEVEKSISGVRSLLLAFVFPLLLAIIGIIIAFGTAILANL